MYELITKPNLAKFEHRDFSIELMIVDIDGPDILHMVMDYLINEIGNDNYFWPNPSMEVSPEGDATCTRYLYFRNDIDLMVFKLRFGL